jgi:uncharacterized protein YndB with AHSA1/START domain
MASITVDSTTTIEAPLETVWAFVSDPNRYPEWSVVTERMTHVDDGPADVGMIYREFGGLGPMTDESEWIITTFDPPRKQVHRGDDGTVQTLLTFEIEPMDGGESTRLHQTIELVFPRGFRLLARLLGWLFLRRMAASALEETVLNAKRIVEKEQSAHAVHSEEPGQ